MKKSNRAGKYDGGKSQTDQRGEKSRPISAGDGGKRNSREKGYVLQARIDGGDGQTQPQSQRHQRNGQQIMADTAVL